MQLYSVRLELLFRCRGKEASKAARAMPCFHFSVEKIRQHRISLIYAFILPTFIKPLLYAGLPQCEALGS